MTSAHATCRAIEPTLVAAATGDADREASRRVDKHIARCAACRADFARYRMIERAVGEIRDDDWQAHDDDREARAQLESRLADLRRRVLVYRIFPSPLGNILIARSDHGVVLVEYLGRGATLEASRLGRRQDVDMVEHGAERSADGTERSADGTEIAALHRELLDYLAGRRMRLGWPLDFRLARGDFDRRVLEATAAIPYGAVTSYARVASAIGQPTASRAVAQALRWNPIPVVVPCHRVVGSSGALVGYAGDKTDLKQRLLAIEGVRTRRTAHDYAIARDAMYARLEDEREYCVPSCPGLSSTSLARLTLYGTRETAEASGLTPCSTCRPDLHPLAV